MDKKVAIISCGMMNYKGPNELEMWNDEATFEVSRKTLDGVNLEREDIDFVVISTMDGLDGITISNGLLAPAAGAYERPSVRIETSGIHCIMSGVADILSGDSDLVMVASSDTLDFDFGYATNFNQDVYFRSPIGFNAKQSFGMLAMDYLRSHSDDEKILAQVAEKNYACGINNPYSHIKQAYSIEEILASKPVSWPLRELEIGKLSNGAVACLLASEEKAKELTDDPIWITGISAAAGNYSGSWQDFSNQAALQIAARKAYQMAGIKNPRQELDLAEIANPFASFELTVYEALGFCEKGEASTILRNGITSANGELPVNLSGGSLCTNPPNSGGLVRTVQALKQLKNEIPGIKTDNARRALVHDSDLLIGAVGGVSHAVLILERGDR